jgi:hypothetical protein
VNKEPEVVQERAVGLFVVYTSVEQGVSSDV